MKKRIIIISTILLVLGFMFCANNVYATKTGSGLTSLFDGTTDTLGGDAGEDIITEVIGTVLSAVRIVAIGLSVVVLTYLGIRYMAAAPTEKADIKKQLIAFTLGAIIVVLSSTIVKVLMDYATSLKIK